MHVTRNSNNIKGIHVNNNFFKNYFFLSVINKWKQARLEIC